MLGLPKPAVPDSVNGRFVPQPVSGGPTFGAVRHCPDQSLLQPQPLSPIHNLQNGEAELIAHVLADARLHLAERRGIDLFAIAFPRCPGSQIPVPLPQQRTALSGEHCPPDVLAEDAAVLVLDLEMLAKPLWQVAVTGMRADAHDAITPVGALASLEQNVEPVGRNARGIQRKAMPRQRVGQIMQRLAGLGNISFRGDLSVRPCFSLQPTHLLANSQPRQRHLDVR